MIEHVPQLVQERADARRCAVEAFEETRDDELNAFARGVVASAFHATVLLKSLGRGVELKVAWGVQETREDVAPEEEDLGNVTGDQISRGRWQLVCDVRFVRADELQVEVGMFGDMPDELMKGIDLGFAKHADDGEVCIQRAWIIRCVKSQRRKLRFAQPVGERVVSGGSFENGLQWQPNPVNRLNLVASLIPVDLIVFFLYQKCVSRSHYFVYLRKQLLIMND